MPVNLRSNTPSEVAVPPVTPIAGQNWVLASGQVGTPGLAMGVMGLTYTKQVADTYTLQYKTVEGKVVGIGLV